MRVNMKIISQEEILKKDIEAFAKDYSEILEKHSALISKISYSKEGKHLLKKEILSVLFH